MKIHGKEYMMVNQRLAIFRDSFPEYTLDCNIVEIVGDTVLMKATITNPEGRLIASGHAYEDKLSSTINKTSHIENCETSAWGRALANLGIGIETSVASADEVDMAIKKQEYKKPKSDEELDAPWKPDPEETVKIMSDAKQWGMIKKAREKAMMTTADAMEFIKQNYGVDKYDQLTQSDAMEVMAYFERVAEDIAKADKIREGNPLF